ncbi:hypothetical protein, partial [Alkalihalophilus marmarensis]|uniref:hypothetical protein n=1 Tax=Alkalihalophilus marmarensis TaxID=521377 RepID=UPI002E1C5C38|nr:hypothetical protein [Alkalihalophilus marmarensis]
KADSIATSVSSLTQTVNNQGSSLSSIQTQVTQQAGLIDQRVTKTEYTADQNGVITRLDNAESVQQQHATLISQRVTETVFNDGLTGLESRLSTAETNITQKADRVDLTSTQTSVDSLTNRMSQAESSLSVQSDRIDQKVDVDGVIAAINVSVDEINGARINLVGAVNVLSDITGNLGTITAGRLEAVEIIGATGTFSGKIVTPIAYFESPTLSERVSLAIQRLSFSPTQHAGYFKLEQMPNVSNTLELSVADSNMMTIPNSAHLRINGQVEVSGLIRSDARVRTEFGLEGSRFWSLHNPSNAILQVNTNGS